MQKYLALCSLILLITGLFGCGEPSQAVESAPEPKLEKVMDTSNNFIACPDDRPEMCTRDYRPVCAKRDTGIRCIATPCPSTEWTTEGNPCTACSNPTVEGFTPGECAEGFNQE